LRPLIPLVALIALVSGCTSTTDPVDELKPEVGGAGDADDLRQEAGPGEGAAVEAATSSAPTVLRFNGSFVAGSSAPVPGEEPRRAEISSDNGVFDFGVNGETEAVVVELVKGADTTGDILLAVGDAKGAWTQVSTGSTGQGGSEARLEFKDLEPGTWKAGGYADGAAAQASYDLYVTLFSGPMPEGYTAIPAS